MELRIVLHNDRSTGRNVALVGDKTPVRALVYTAAIAWYFGGEVLCFGPDDGIEDDEPGDTSGCDYDDVVHDFADLLVG